MKKINTLKFLILTTALIGLISCQNSINQTDTEKPVDFLKNTKVVLTSQHNFTPENPELTQEFTTKNGKHILIYKLGKAENYLLETFITPVMKTDLIKVYPLIMVKYLLRL